MTLSSILLAIALGVANIALKEIKFGTSAKDTDDAFFASDTGVECALYNDKQASNSFVASGGSGTVSCLNRNIPISGAYPSWNFVVTGLGSTGLYCANVSVVKDAVTHAPSVVTTVTSKGYNIGDSSCLSTNPDRIEREIIVSY